MPRREVEKRIGAVERLWAPLGLRTEGGPAFARRTISLRALGGFEVTIEPDQFLDIGDAFWLGEPVSFAPATTSSHSDEWLRRWRGGLLTTCGLAAVGVDTDGRRGGMHGRATSIPAVVTRCEGAWDGDEYRLEVRGSMREGAIFAQNVTVARTIRACVGVAGLEIHDVIRNEGFSVERVRLLYHVNLGWPLLDVGGRVAADAARPDSPGTSLWSAPVEAPEAGAVEQTDALVPLAGDDSWSSARLERRDGTTFVLTFRPAQLGHLTIWRSRAAGSYALGLEPGTCWPSHIAAPETGKLGRELLPGEELVTDLRIAIVAEGDT